MENFTVEPAAPASLPACFALLPGLAFPDAVVFTARDDKGQLLGAGGVLWRGWGQPAGMPCWITVLPDSRRMGVGRRLLSAIAREAATEGADLIAVDMVEQGSDGALFASACGAVTEGRQFYFAGDPRALHVIVSPLVEMLRRRGRVPASARVVPLADAPLDEVKWLISTEFRTAPVRVQAMLGEAHASGRSPTLFDRETSFVLMVGDQVAGALLSVWQAGRNAATVLCNLVGPTWRGGGWANAMLLDAYTHGIAEAGCYRVAFDCADDVRDTIGLARRGKADQLGVKLRLRYAA